MTAARLALAAAGAAAAAAVLVTALARLSLPTMTLTGQVGPAVVSVHLAPAHLSASFGSSNMRISVALPLRNE